jgi:serine/threonine protein phosphatase PrpC
VKPATDARCHECGSPVLPSDSYCERCGTALLPEARLRAFGCGACRAGARTIGVDGACTACGAQNHRTVDIGDAAAITHRGRVRRRNEDAVVLEAAGRDGIAVVVCDGVSVSTLPEVAADRAARAGGAVLARALDAGSPSPREATSRALAEAQAAVAAIPVPTGASAPPPACTYVSLVLFEGTLTIGWVGDSRAYWIGEDPRRLTVDNSLAEEQGNRGRDTERAANSTSHAITRWLGIDAPEGPEQILAFAPSAAGRAVVCSDGFWGYAPSAEDVVRVVDAPDVGVSPAEAALRLVTAALDAGGRDNITVAVVDWRSGEGRKGE